MEPLWSPVVATGGSQWQIRSARKPPKQAKSVTAGCHRLREKFHGKEGVEPHTMRTKPAHTADRDRRAAKAHVLGTGLGTELVAVLPLEATKIAVQVTRRGGELSTRRGASTRQSRLTTAAGEHPRGSASAIGSRGVTVRWPSRS
jgi:hypothetical protein